MFYLKDHLGSSRVIVDTTGKITAKYNYYPFGDNLNSSVSQGSEYKYTGKELDEEGGFGLYYYGARYYDARLSKWVSTDKAFGKFLPEGSGNKNLPAGGVYNSIN